MLSALDPLARQIVIIVETVRALNEHVKLPVDVWLYPSAEAQEPVALVRYNGVDDMQRVMMFTRRPVAAVVRAADGTIARLVLDAPA